MRIVEGGGRVLLCTWHQQFFAAIRHFRNYRRYRPALMISKSRDGDVIARVAERSGWMPVRGSSSRDGEAALALMAQHLRETGLAGHVVDGPRGPAGRVKAGLVRLALAGDAVIVPFCVVANKPWHLRSWDRFLVPKPFSRVTLRFLEAVAVGPISGPEQIEAERQRIERLMLPALIR
jgi:lysophospholipid acyltransferase (LPLAT)-like uncharacterized protein